MKKLLFLLLATTLLFSACKKETVTNKDRIIGTWNSYETFVNGVNTSSTLWFNYDFSANGDFASTTSNPQQTFTDVGEYYFRNEDEVVLKYSDNSTQTLNISFQGSKNLTVSSRVSDAQGNNYLVRIYFEKQ